MRQFPHPCDTSGHIAVEKIKFFGRSDRKPSIRPAGKPISDARGGCKVVCPRDSVPDLSLSADLSPAGRESCVSPVGSLWLAGMRSVRGTGVAWSMECPSLEGAGCGKIPQSLHHTNAHAEEFRIRPVYAYSTLAKGCCRLAFCISDQVDRV